ncbi:MAG: hypothetical protein HC837_06495 [Chloroflexaceae bacterium]|nr:hypothetical protein [Chloroflexaceae bacterium]
MSQPTPINMSLFDLLKEHLGEDVPILHCSKATLVHLSHTLEDLVLSERLEAMIFTGFQESSHWREETERYRALAQVAQQVCIFAGGVLPEESQASELHVTLQGNDPLRQEWFLAILSTHFAIILCGKDRYEPFEIEARRQFETIWTFEPQLVKQVLDLLEQVVTHYRPEKLATLQANRDRFPLQPPDAHIVTRFTSEMIRFQEELNRSIQATTDALVAQMRWREELTETLVHDLRTPLSGLMMTLQMLGDEQIISATESKDMLDIALGSAETIENLIQLILDTNSLEAGTFPMHWEAISPNNLVSEGTRPLTMLFQHHGVQWQQDIHPSIDHIWGDRSLLTRVIQNLVGNAIKFTPPDGQISVDVRPRLTNEQVEVCIRDTGVGINPTALPHIFERRYRAQPSDRRGTGIGLFFCRLAVEAHGGNIRADSRPGVGTSITFTLPTRTRDLLAPHATP